MKVIFPSFEHVKVPFTREEVLANFEKSCKEYNVCMMCIGYPVFDIDLECELCAGTGTFEMMIRLKKLQSFQ